MKRRFSGRGGLNRRLWNIFEPLEQRRMLTVSGSAFASLVPASVNPGDTVAMMTVSLTASGSGDVFDLATIRYQGTSTADVSALRIYRESDGIAGFSAADTLEATDTTASSSQYELDMNSSLPLGVTRQYYAVLDLKSTATVGNTIALQVQRFGFRFETSTSLPTNSGSWVTGVGTIAAPAPVQTATPSLALLADTGSNSSDFITNNTNLTGSAEAGATVQIFNGAALLGTTTANGSGTWNLAAGLPDGTYTFTANATASGKTISAASAALTATFDTTAPVINGILTPSAAPSGWYNLATGAPTVSFNANDLHLLSVSGPTTLGEGAGQSVTGTATDLAGNSASVTVSGIHVDLTVPSITAQRDTAANGFGWNNTDVQASYAASDSLSGLLSAANGSHTFSDEGAAQSHTFTVFDLAGNSASATVSDVNIDKTAPLISAQRDTAANGFGWNNTDVQASYAASDSLSGLLSAANGSHTFSDEGAAQSHTFTVFDLAGNSASSTVSDVNIDKTAPLISAQRDTAANAFGWNNTDVDSSYLASDALSGLLSPSTGSHSFSSEGAGQSHTFTVFDLAGNSSSATVSDVNIDKTAPILNAPADIVTGPNNIAGAIVDYEFSPADLLSGIDVQTSLPGSGSLFAVGTTTVSLSATDKAGNTTTGSFNVTVNSAGVDSDGNLWLLGQGCGVTILIDANDPSNVIVSGSGGVNGSYSLGPSGRIIAIGTFCGDVIRVSGKVDAELHGLAGNDVLEGGAGHDVLIGGDGDDNLTGGAGNDVLCGDFGNDRMVGSAGHDVLVAIQLNSESFESLNALRSTWLATWGASDPDEGVDAAENPTAEGGDMLTGSAGRDWFLVGSNDRITDVGKLQTGFAGSFWTKNGEDFIDVY